MALEDIERLKEKIGRDPNSKLFVPLAEEYKKAGMLDEAIEVLTGGLEHQPGYLSARVSLGKIFIDRGMLREAKTEFEKVIAAIPDNLYAHKKLAEIYKELGDKDKATKEFRSVLKLNPLDDWAAASLADIEQQPAFLPEELSVPETEEVIPVDEKTPGIHEHHFEITDIEESPPAVEMQEEKTHMETAPDTYLSEENTGPWQRPSVPAEELKVEEKEVPEFVLDAEELKPGGPSGEIGEISEFRDEEIAETALSEEDMAIWKSHAESLKSVEEEEAKEPATATDEAEIDLWKPLYEMREREEEEQPEPAAEAEEVTMPEPVAEADEIALPEFVAESETEAFTAEEPLSFEGILNEEAIAVEEATPLIQEKEPRGEEGLTIGNADRYIADGKYFSAMNIYRKILAQEPDNKQALQRVEELRSLLKLMGKDKEELLSKLDGFLDGIRKRHDEFSGTA
jgi:tetratricopeptide (TPR) repeat protein